MTGKGSKTVDLANRILCSFTAGTEELGISELSRKLNVYPSKIHRTMSSLVDAGFVEQNSVTKKYRIGQKLFEIGSLYLIHLRLRKIVRTQAVELARTFDCSVHLGIISKTVPHSVIIIDRFLSLQSDNTVIHRMSFNVPLHSSSLGKILLAFSDTNFRESIIDELTFERFTPKTIVEKAKFRNELSGVRLGGYAIDRGETHRSLYCIGAPIIGKNKLIAAISVSDIKEKVEKRERTIREEVVKAAEVLSLQLEGL